MKRLFLLLIVFIGVCRAAMLQIDNSTHNERIVQSGSDFSLTCRSQGPVEWLLPYYYFLNVDPLLASRINISNSFDELVYSTLTVTNASYVDTGSYTCRLLGSINSTSQYVYVEDARNLVIWPQRTLLATSKVKGLAVKFQFTFPCKATHPSVRVFVKNNRNKEIKSGDWKLDPFKGFSGLRSKNAPEVYYQCCGSSGNDTQCHSYKMTFTGKSPLKMAMSQPKPLVVGNNVTFNCSVEYNIRVDVNWVIPNLQSNRSRISEIEYNESKSDKVVTGRALSIENIQLDDAGDYICIATDDSGELIRRSGIAKLQVRETGQYLNITILQDEYEGVVYENETVRWEFLISSQPPAKLNLKGSINSRFSIAQTDSTATVTVKDIQLEDSGNYSVEAFNGVLNQSVQFHFRVFELPATRWTSASNSTLYRRNEWIEITCEVQGDWINPLVSYRHCLGKNRWDKVINTSPHKVNESAKQVTISKRATDSVRYSCKTCVRSTCGPESFTYFIVSGGAKLLPEEKRMEISEGRDLLMTCQIDACFFTAYDWNWRSNNQSKPIDVHQQLPFRFKRSESTQVNTFNANLNISKIERAATGTITCSVLSHTGETIHKSIDIYVRPVSKPLVRAVSPPEVKIQLGSPVTLTCQSDTLTSDAQWQKDGNELDAINEPGLSSYSISSAKQEDAGEYRCIFQNDVGEGEQLFKVQVIAPQSPVVWTFLTISLIALMLILSIGSKFYRDKMRAMSLQTEELAQFHHGDPQNINPDLTVVEQAQLLPYDPKWELPRDRIRLGRRLGCGAFGQVLQAKATGIKGNDHVTTVAVKMSQSQSNQLAVKSLMSELKIMTHLGSHLNVINLLGACTSDVPRQQLLIVMEYCRHGNIRNYLIRHRNSFIDETNAHHDTWDVSYNVSSLSVDMLPQRRCTSRKWISTRDLNCWSFQIARGMAYLASRKVLHGDLAARNVLLADDNVVKVADFGLARNIYRSGLYKKKGKEPLPVKWMAVESIGDRIFSTQSDVWAYGIVLWELFSLGKSPYPVIEVDDHFVQRLKDGYRMSQPYYASDDMYQVMLQCWQLEPTERPDFNRLEELMAAHLDESVRQRYLKLDEPHLQVNNQRTDDYLLMMKSPDYVNVTQTRPPTFVTSLPIQTDRPTNPTPQTPENA